MLCHCHGSHSDNSIKTGKWQETLPKKLFKSSKSHGIRNRYNFFSFFLKVQMDVRLAEAEGPFNFDEAAGKHWRISFWHKSLQQSPKVLFHEKFTFLLFSKSHTYVELISDLPKNETEEAHSLLVSIERVWVCWRTHFLKVNPVWKGNNTYWHYLLSQNDDNTPSQEFVHFPLWPFRSCPVLNVKKVQVWQEVTGYFGGGCKRRAKSDV